MSSLAQILILLVTAIAIPAALLAGATALGLLFIGPAFEASLQLYVPLLANRPFLFNFGLAGVCGLSLVLGLSRQSLSFEKSLNRASVAMLLIVGLSLVSQTWSAADADARSLITNSIPYTILYLVIAPLLIARLEDLRRIAVTISVVGSAVALSIVLNPNVTLQTGRLDTNLGGFGINPLALGFLGGMLFLIAILYRPRRVGWFVLPGRIGVALLGARLTLDSGSRGQLLLAAMIGIGFIPLSRPVKDLARFVISIVGMAVAVLVLRFAMTAFITSKNEERWSLESITDGIGGRLELVWISLSDFLGSPQSWLLGRGAGRFSTLGADVGAPYPHNFLVESLAELGLVGLAAYGTVILITLKAALTLWRRHQNDLEQRMLATVMIAMAAFSFLLTFKEGTIHDPGTKLFALLVLVRLASLDAMNEPAVEDLDEESADDLDPTGERPRLD